MSFRFMILSGALWLCGKDDVPYGPAVPGGTKRYKMGLPEMIRGLFLCDNEGFGEEGRNSLFMLIFLTF